MRLGASQLHVPQVLQPAGRSAAEHRRWRWGFAEWFVIAQTVLPALLYLPGTQPLRVPIRVGFYGLSLVALLWCLLLPRASVRPHPARPWLVVVIVWLSVMIFHPTTNTLLAGVAQAGLYLAVLAPVLWVPSLVRRPEQLSRLLAILLVCCGVNAAVGILQVYDPDRWLPREFSSVSQGGYGIDSLTYVGAGGRRIIRPPGLSDSPGAVCGPAAAAAILGVVFCIERRLAWWRRVASLGFAFVGVAAIYLTQVRSSFVVLLASLFGYVAILFMQREPRRATLLLTMGVAVVVGSFAFALLLGGDKVFVRYVALFVGDSGTTYYNARGNQIEHAFRVLLGEYPIGAGLGRWGMMRHYFGDERNRESPPLWAEIQWPAWILDGGVPLMLLYACALFSTTAYCWRLTQRHPDPEVRSMTGLVLAMSIGTLALLFSYTPFTSPSGVQFWMLAGAVHGVATGGGGGQRATSLAEESV
jgi:hypothetical protein